MIETKKVKANGLNFNVAFAGPVNGKPVFLLHGFPDFWFCWEAQMKALAKEGFRVIVPDQRGYNLTDKPPSIDDYKVSCLVADIIALADVLEIEKFYLAGHDFGGMVSWSIATLHPERLKRMVILSAPHFLASVVYGKTNITQKLKSWYIVFFQLISLPEHIIKAFDYALLVRNMSKELDDKEIERYKKAWGQPDGLRSMVNWYRGLMKGVKEREIEYGLIHTPVHIVWGESDKYLEPGLGKLSLEQCANGKLTVFPDTSHWVMKERSEEVSRILIQHFAQ